MLEKIHDHIVSEMQQNSRTDTVFIVTAVIFNFIVLAINSGIAQNANQGYGRDSDDMVLVVFIIMSLLINTAAVIALNHGRRSREKLLAGLVTMYEDNDVSRYYDSSLMKSYGMRYWLIIAILIALAAASIAVPLIIRFS